MGDNHQAASHVDACQTEGSNATSLARRLPLNSSAAHDKAANATYVPARYATKSSLVITTPRRSSSKNFNSFFYFFFLLFPLFLPLFLFVSMSFSLEPEQKPAPPLSSNPASMLLPPGFRFHPTDEELIHHYLAKRASGLPCPVPIIAEVDIYKFDPWDLPGFHLQPQLAPPLIFHIIFSLI